VERGGGIAHKPGKSRKIASWQLPDIIVLCQ
jgi:hypothetical protein